MKKRFYALLLVLAVLGGGVLRAESLPAASGETLAQQARSIQIRGQVLDAQTNEPVIGAGIIVVGTNIGTVTDEGGNYVLGNVPAGAVLQISCIGYETQEVTARQNMPIILLSVNTRLLDEVVVIGYGVQRKADLTGAVANVTADKLNTSSNATIGQALQGKIAGVDIVSYGGAPGAGTRIMVRGIGTLNNSEPLYIVDGMYMSTLDNINPNDIKSIDVLKDASAAAIYGSRAANGVVIITTKSGSDTDGVPEVNASFNFGVAHASKKLPVLNAAEWAQVSTEARAANGLPPQDMAQNLSEKEDNDWQDIFFHYALIQNYNVSVQGGGKYTKYYTSIGMNDRDGTVKGSHFQRYNIQSKLDFTKGRFSAGTNIVGSYDNDLLTNSDFRGGYIARIVAAIPTLQKYDPNMLGGYGGYYGDVVNYENPLGMIDRNLMDGARQNARIFVNLYAQFEILKGLKYKVNFSPDFQFARNTSYKGVYSFGLQSSAVTQMTDSQIRRNNMLVDHLLTYDNTFGKHKVSALVGYSYQDVNYRILEGQGTGMATGIRELSNAATKSVTNGSSTRSVMISWLGRAFYSYDNRYLVTATFRRDGSSKFTGKYHWGNFPSFSLGWNVAEEPFMRHADWLNQLKVRGGYGVLGNQEVSDYQFAATVNTGINYPNGAGGVFQGAFPKNFANPDIHWETTAMTNFGVDFLAFKDRLSFTADWYNKNTYDILLSVPIPGSTGGSGNITKNTGVINNTGFEFNIGWNDFVNRDFGYSVSFLGTFNKNEVVAMGTENQQITGGAPHGGAYTCITQKGYPIGSFWLIPTDGYFNSEAEVQAYKDKDGKLIQPNAQPGDIRFVDSNGDGAINDQDRVYSGSPFPDLTFALNGSVTWKNWDFALNFQGVVGNKIYNATRQALENLSIGTNYSKDMLNAWTPTNHDASVPRLAVTDANNNGRNESDRFLEDGSYLRLRNVTVGYNIPSKVFGGVLKHTKVFLNAENLFTLTKYRGFSPDVNAGSVHSRGFDEFIYPANRIFMLGLNVSF